VCITLECSVDQGRVLADDGVVAHGVPGGGQCSLQRPPTGVRGLGARVRKGQHRYRRPHGRRRRVRMRVRMRMRPLVRGHFQCVQTARALYVHQLHDMVHTLPYRLVT
jgi:hypothetical protein